MNNNSRISFVNPVLQLKEIFSVKDMHLNSITIAYVDHKYLLNNIVENNTIGMTQFKSIKKPNIKFPIKAPPLPNVNDNAAAITL